MILKRLEIRKAESWEKETGFTGLVVFESPESQVHLKIDDATARRILTICSDGVIAAAAETASMIGKSLVPALEMDSGESK